LQRLTHCADTFHQVFCHRPFSMSSIRSRNSPK
jgi:hypothetical protein